MKKASNSPEMAVVTEVPTIIGVVAPVEPYAVAMTAKEVVKSSCIKVAKATLQVIQNGTVLFERSTEGLDLSRSYAQLSNIFHYQFKGKKVRLDKFNTLTLRLTFGEAVYMATKPAHTNKKGEYVPFTSGSVGGLLKVLYHNFAADIMESVTLQGKYFNYVHAANTIANFTSLPVRAAAKAK